ncbi:hypothetical protein BASA83_010537 [Batrachochytrium salamandrivorans]|nr:hypothetical protein BASA83_010537 [Batrachochytrium salamandrivorans]
MDQAIRIDNRIFERKQEQQYNPRQFRRNQPPTQPASRTHPQQYQHRYVDNFNHHPIQQPSLRSLQLPSNHVEPLRHGYRLCTSWSSNFFGKTTEYSCFCTLFPQKLLLPGTLRLGPLSHVDTFFVDCGADDLFMDSKLAADLQIPLLELSTPITLRLADGDSSSSLTHRTVPLQLHIGKHVETATFYELTVATVSFSVFVAGAP